MKAREASQPPGFRLLNACISETRVLFVKGHTSAAGSKHRQAPLGAQAKITSVFESIGLDGAKMATFENVGPLETWLESGAEGTFSCIMDKTKTGKSNEKHATPRMMRKKGLRAPAFDSSSQRHAEEMLVRKSTNGETWVQHVVDGLISMLPEDRVFFICFSIGPVR